MVEQTICQDCKFLPVRFWTLSPGTLSILSNIFYQHKKFKFLCKKLYVNNLQFEENKEKEITIIDEKYIIYYGKLINVETNEILKNDIVDHKVYDGTYYIKNMYNQWFAFGNNKFRHRIDNTLKLYIDKPKKICRNADQFVFNKFWTFYRVDNKWYTIGNHLNKYFEYSYIDENIDEFVSSINLVYIRKGNEWFGMGHTFDGELGVGIGCALVTTPLYVDKDIDEFKFKYKLTYIRKGTEWYGMGNNRLQYISINISADVCIKRPTLLEV